ncbi:hypothetical protein I8G32_03693 [Rhodopseudomonas palustris]|uniref:DUF4393 domain-containing protein n=1 Tax=Rhodopseudomonas palustris (strain ATCC BAA-98 / CGA009) TaxID=258594 RepID=Q6N3W5_RHOPA|nr:DUF4393 domain-containing protein [Rhodopseudomonas palustris]OPF97619.1 hypothetical protein B1S06_00150 [Rhodopseudomonas palustris]QQM05125.1 hypothetical protein I8G32_03693 [Rhodopseudomonas palustris]RJF70289.1 DUF4393 domain-containing protein [Rhodopseudomonas palustris]WAB76478.1 DUF4393 domain-containing protein [Rhodopseudomonas palustris]WCL93754.1 DUF4393 domain-containing protein [Rhodopseudomonas palustris CGA009]
MSDLEETAKAVQEASKLGRDLVKGLKPLAKIAQQILGPFGEGYGLLTDLVHHKREEIEWRFANRKKIYKLALEQVRARAIELEQLNPIPTRIAHDYEDGIEREDEEILQQLWANLLINVTDPQTGILPRKVFRDILGKLDPEQALFLNELGLRIDTIQFYFIVCNAFHNGQSGCELAFAPFEARKDEIVSSELFSYNSSEDSHSFFVLWPTEKVEATVDILQVTGLVHWRNELHLAEELFDTDLNLTGAKDPAEIGRLVLANASGIRAFSLSQLGEEFVRAVSPFPPKTSP